MKKNSSQLNTNNSPLTIDNSPLSLYVHIPYCRNICDYCSFTVERGNAVPDDYVRALKTDWLHSIYYFKEPIKLKTIYLGGGTPSLLSNYQLKDLLHFFSEWRENNDTEITIEANPTSLLPKKIESWLKAGVNRISMGVQSFSKDTLKYLTRTHSPSLSKKAVQTLKASGVKSYNIDLIYGMKTQSVDEFAEDLCYLLEQHPPHLSAYELTIEENTPFHQTKQKQRNEDEVAEMVDILVSETAKNNLHRYEISNFAQEGHTSKHNINYWKNLPYFGIGCGAFSYINRKRYSKVKNPIQYIQSVIMQENLIDFEEKLDDEKYARETLVIGLRMTKGLSLAEFTKQTKFDALQLIGPKLSYFVAEEFLYIKNDEIKLTPKGMRVANSILSEIV